MKKTVKKKIKKSHIAMLGGLALIFLTILGFIIAARIIAGPAQGWDGRGSSRRDGTSNDSAEAGVNIVLKDLKDFTGVKVMRSVDHGDIAERRVSVEGAGNVRERQ